MIENLEIFDKVIGKKLTGVVQCKDELWLTFDEDIVTIGFPRIEVDCMDCRKRRLEI